MQQGRSERAAAAVGEEKEGRGDGGGPSLGVVVQGRGGVEASTGNGGGSGGAKGGGGGDGVTYTRLFSKNEDVDRLNVQELKKLKGARAYSACVHCVCVCNKKLG